MASLESLNTAIDTAYKEAKQSADDALQKLGMFASLNSGAIPYPSQDGIWQEDKNVVAPLNGIDSFISNIKLLSDYLLSLSEKSLNLPSDISADLEMQNSYVWTTDLEEKLKTELNNYLTTMGVPDKDFQDSIFNESYERNLQSLNDLLQLADAKVGARGFTYNNDQSTALKLEAQQKYQFDRNQISRDVTKLVTEWARQNYQLALEKGIAFEQFHADFTYKFSVAAVDVYIKTLEATVTRFKAEMEQKIYPLTNIVAAANTAIAYATKNADIEKDNIMLDIEDQKLRLNEAQQVFNTGTQAAVATYQAQVESLKTVATQTAAMIQAATRSVIGVQKQ